MQGLLKYSNLFNFHLTVQGSTPLDMIKRVHYAVIDFTEYLPTQSHEKMFLLLHLGMHVLSDMGYLGNHATFGFCYNSLNKSHLGDILFY